MSDNDLNPEPLHPGTIGAPPDSQPKDAAAQKDAASMPQQPVVHQSSSQTQSAGADAARPHAPNARRSQRHHDVATEDVAGPSRPRARLGLFLGVALVAVIGSGVVVGVVRSKRLHVEPQVQLPVHVVRAPDPIAREAFRRGMRALLDDTDESYQVAARAFDAAITRDPEFTDAWAGAALAATFLAQDSQAAAADARSRLEHGAALMVGQPDAAECSVAAASGLARFSTEAAALERQSVASLRHAAAILLHGEHLTVQTPLMATAVGLWYAGASDDASVRALVEPQLATAEMLADGSLVPESDAGKVPSVSANSADSAALSSELYTPWRALAHAQALAATPQVQEAEVTRAYEQALAIEPGLRRARWELAALAWRRGHVVPARALLVDLAHSRPPHAKAEALLEALSQNEGEPQPAASATNKNASAKNNQRLRRSAASSAPKMPEEAHAP